MAAGTADAAKISFSEKGFVDVGGLVQAQYRIEQDAAGSGKDPSHDFLLRRARLIIAGQFNDNIGFLVDTDVSYATGPGTTSNAPANTGATGVYNGIYLLDAVATYKVSKEFLLDAGLMLNPGMPHDGLTSGAKFVTVNGMPLYFSPNSQRATRDVGIGIRGLLLDDRLYYRMGVFNGVQTRPTISTTTGTPPVTTTTPGINPGDAPRFAGTLRFNIAGKEDGYAFCQMCFASSPIVSIGVAADFQANAFRGIAPIGPTPPASNSPSTGMGSWTTGYADLFADIPFSPDLELVVEAEFSKVWAGSNTNSSGTAINGLAALRFGVIAPYFQIEWFNSDVQYVGAGNAGTQAAPVGDLTTYRGGLSWFLLQHTYKISAEIAFQNREKGGETVDGASIPKNHWVGTLQFQAGF
ncbi:MAG TPA: porin [Candidatus Polarisedimenticolaceae bacterium]|nr:porin [Candidatus Polarisedimenticolaceae bacterium]